MTGDRERIARALPGYEIGEELGRGGWGIVFGARHRQLQRDVAVKLLPTGLADDDELRRRFVSEARLLASLDHPHIVPVYDFVEQAGMFLLVMERLGGGTVRDHIGERRADPAAGCAVALATAEGLHHAHRRGVLHRDVKPENLLLTPAGVAKVSDFGIAKVLGGAGTVATRAGAILGTPAYMAPEQARGAAVGPETDVFALGVVLYELLSGRLPTELPDEASPLALLHARAYEPPRDLAEVAPDVPGTVIDVVMGALEPEQSRRTADAQRFAIALAAAATAWLGPGWLERSGIEVVPGGPVAQALHTSDHRGRARRVRPARTARRPSFPAGAPRPLCARVQQACERLLAELPPGREHDEVAGVLSSLADPLRIAIGGPAGAGKSTLLNALLRQRVAPTGQPGSSPVVTWYRYGPRPRAEAVGHDGARHEVVPDGDDRATIRSGGSVAAADHIEVFVDNHDLRQLTLIDTPGTSAGGEPVGGDAEPLGATQSAVAEADALVFVAPVDQRPDVANIRDGLRALRGASVASPLNTVVALNRADLLTAHGEPLEEATRLAAGYRSALRGTVATAVPLVSLLAETVETGRFTEAHAAALAETARTPGPGAVGVADPADRLLDPSGPGGTDRAELVDLLGAYGVAVALTRVTEGAGHADIMDTLRRRSGVRRIREVVFGAFARDADAIKAHAALATLEQLAFGMNDPALAGPRQSLHDEIESIRLDRAMHRLSELRVAQECAEGSLELPAELLDELHRSLLAVSPAGRLGLPGDAADDELQAAALAAAQRWKRFGNDPRRAPREQWAAEVMARSFEQVWLAAAGRG